MTKAPITFSQDSVICIPLIAHMGHTCLPKLLSVIQENEILVGKLCLDRGTKNWRRLQVHVHVSYRIHVPGLNKIVDVVGKEF